MPLYVHTVGYNKQNPMSRPEGFSTHQLLFAREGQGRMSLNGKEEFVFGPMQYLLVPAELPHEYYPISDEPWEVGYVSFAGTNVRELLEHFDIEVCRLRDLPDADFVWRMLDDMWLQADANEAGSEWKAAHSFYGLMLELNRMKSMEEKLNLPSSPSLSEDTVREVVRQAAHYFNEHYNENISLSNVASALGYTHQYLNRLFRRVHGMSMLQYVQQVRLDKAIELMSVNPGITVKDIAGAIGMETNYFIRTFRKATGMTPDQYRKNK